MRPKTRLQAEVFQYSRNLFGLRKAELEWAERVCLDHKGYATKNRVLCMDCGETFSPELVKRKRAVCPHCAVRLRIEQTAKRTDKQEVIFATAEICGDFQVIRYYELRANYKAGYAAYIRCNEVVQLWILPDERWEVVAKSRSMNGYFYGDMEIRYKKQTFSNYSYSSSHMRYNLYAEKFYPGSVIKQQYRKYGINHTLQGITFLEAIWNIPKQAKLETLLKARQYDLLYNFLDRGHAIERYWSSIKICLRNKYRISDASMWIDYMDLLKYFGKDLRNAHYVCPKNLKMAHDRLMKKKREKQHTEELKLNYLNMLEFLGEKNIDKNNFEFPKNLKRAYAILNARYEKEKAIVEQMERDRQNEEYKKFIARFEKLVLVEKDIEIRPLTSVQEFAEEGDTLHHCVYTNEYFKQQNSLILSARRNGERLETIEFDLKRLSVVQSRGKYNSETEHHKQIVKIVNSNRNKIKQLAIMLNRITVAENSAETGSFANSMFGDVLVLDVPNGSYNFSITEWDDFNEEHTLRYDVQTHYAGASGQTFGHTQRHSEAIVISKKGNWVIEKIENGKVVVKNIA